MEEIGLLAVEIADSGTHDLLFIAKRPSCWHASSEGPPQHMHAIQGCQPKSSANDIDAILPPLFRGKLRQELHAHQSWDPHDTVLVVYLIKSRECCPTAFKPRTRLLTRLLPDLC
jgi:hypothetical protein